MSTARNIQLYPWFQALQSLIFWLPIFFLYFSSKLSVSQVLLLEAIYYAFVVLLEVPSGYLSDRYGRKRVLLISSACWVFSGLLFCIANSFVVFACAQALVACGMAFRSGSDSSLLYESLKFESRQSEIADHEARAQTWSLVAFAIAAIVGGALAMHQLYLPYLLSALSSLAAFFVAMQFREPAAQHTQEREGALRLLVLTGKDRLLAWVMLFSVALTVLVHIPYELLQPYTGFALDGAAGPGDWQSTPLISGVLLALTMLLGAWAAVYAVRLMEKFGVGGSLFIGVAIISTIVFAMTLWMHWIVLPLLLLRSVAMAISTPVIHAVVHDRLPDAVRATYLSLQSLLGRLAFSAVLLLGSAVSAGAALTPRLLGELLGWYSGLIVLLLPVLYVGLHSLNRHAATPQHGGVGSNQASE